MNLSRRTMIAWGIGVGGSLVLPNTPAWASARRLTALPDPQTRGALVWDATPGGYVAHEFLLSGLADVYEPVASADSRDTSTRTYAVDFANRDFSRTTLAVGQPYTTRLIVYRPADPTRFSGNVVVETAHPAGGGNPGVFSRISHFLMANADIYVSVSHPITLPQLKAIDPVRYAALQSVDPTQLWGMLADVGRLIRGGGDESPLGGAAPRRVYMTGFSYTGVATGIFANHHHDTTRMADGSPVYDGYAPGGAAVYARPLDVPIIRLGTQGDFANYNAVNNRRDDSDEAIGRHRHYELAGCSHGPVAWQHPLGALRPRTRLENAAGLPFYDNEACEAAFPATSVGNDYPLRMVQAALFRNLYDWVDHGVPPPRVARIAVDSSHQTRLDDHGNAVGGLRLPQVEVPVATYGVGLGRACQNSGFKTPFTPDKRRRLYGTQAGYVEQVRMQTDQLVDTRLLLAEDAAALVEAARLEAI